MTPARPPEVRYRDVFGQLHVRHTWAALLDVRKGFHRGHAEPWKVSLLLRNGTRREAYVRDDAQVPAAATLLLSALAPAAAELVARRCDLCDRLAWLSQLRPVHFAGAVCAGRCRPWSWESFAPRPLAQQPLRIVRR